MLSGDNTTSFAGTWGKSIKEKAQSPGKNRTTGNYTTTFSASFNADKFSTFSNESNNKFAKFVRIYI